MEELKTLEDLEKAVHVGDVKKFLDEENEVGADWMTSIILAGDLKAEAVKCLTFGIDNYKTPEEVSSKIIQNFVDFFNWTEEELKDDSEVFKKRLKAEAVKQLKTLKDLDSNQTGFYRNIDEVEVFKKRLKAEAVKHYKAIKEGNLCIDVFTYIKWANNLTEEELGE